ncbi:FliH/SctL family protein [Succinimonas amylolytica]|uniref:FliH/SctL family protein n=1 Tax=Succinimonas amylolytica TaxID=83769 RepID=UPI000A04E713|nr:FliH/SctL family protein [Succinimonas amylolytica]
MSEQDRASPMEFEYLSDAGTESRKRETNAMGYASDWYEKGLEARKKSQEKAREEAEIRASMPTLAEIEDIRKSAYDDGFREGKKLGFETGYAEGVPAGENAGREAGLKSGYDEGREAGLAEMQRQAARFCSYANHLVKPIQDLDEETASELIYLAGRLARAFIRMEVARSAEYAASEIAEACRLLPVASGDVSISINPEFIDEIKTILRNPSVRLVPDPSLKPGDLRADVAMSSIEINLEERIDAFLSEFLVMNRERRGEAALNSAFKEEPCARDFSAGSEASGISGQKLPDEENTEISPEAVSETKGGISSTRPLGSGISRAPGGGGT